MSNILDHGLDGNELFFDVDVFFMFMMYDVWPRPAGGRWLASSARRLPFVGGCGVMKVSFMKLHLELFTFFLRSKFRVSIVEDKYCRDIKKPKPTCSFYLP